MNFFVEEEEGEHGRLPIGATPPQSGLAVRKGGEGQKACISVVHDVGVPQIVSV